MGKKNPSTRLGLQAYLLSHIKAPLREEKRGIASYPGENITILLNTCNQKAIGAGTAALHRTTAQPGTSCFEAQFSP
jgi:hypothetical protein